eukprot:TRINITY_DN5915_c0_g2_i1.p1 TRINITY_DN5915_c0_g2~~TRINITY_DN5915_c0_g2_i1.p1  ORF type:complete len:499 (+),score=32.60 TRINITY_DN5915_c0_g2_i1:205-1701(+)
MRQTPRRRPNLLHTFCSLLLLALFVSPNSVEANLFSTADNGIRLHSDTYSGPKWSQDTLSKLTQNSNIITSKRQHVFDLSDFGAVGDGITDNTRVFQNALYALSGVADKGGGQLYIPPGRFVTGSFNLSSNMTLYLAREAVILGSLSTSLWPVISALPSYGRGREMPGPRYSSLLYGQYLEDVIITGENGTIDGRGAKWWAMAANGTLKYSRGSLIEILWSNNVVVANITLLNSPFWTLHPTYCKKVLVTNVNIWSPEHALSTDGIVPDSCTDVLIADVRITTGGDGISIKSGWDEYGIELGVPSESILVHKAVIHAPLGAAFAIGSEMSGGVYNVTAVDLCIVNSTAGVMIKTAPGRGGHIKGIYLNNVTMDGVGVGIKFVPNCTDHPDDLFDPNALPVVKGLGLRSVQGTAIGQAGALDGLEAQPFEDICLTDVMLRIRPGGLGFKCAFVEGLARNVFPEPCPELLPPTDKIWGTEEEGTREGQRKGESWGRAGER